MMRVARIAYIVVVVVALGWVIVDRWDQIVELLGEMQHQFPRWIIPPLGVNFDRRLFGESSARRGDRVQVPGAAPQAQPFAVRHDR